MVRDGFKEMRAEFEKVHERLEKVHERLDSIDRCLDDDFGPRLKGLQAAVKRIEDGLPQ